MIWNQRSAVGLVLALMLLAALFLTFSVLHQRDAKALRVGYVNPVFTITPYWHSYWNGTSDGCFYSFYAYAARTLLPSDPYAIMKSHLDWLSCKVVFNQTAELPSTYNSSLFIPNLLSILRQNFTLGVVDDVGVNNGELFSNGARRYDVLVLSHEEYVTDSEFAQFQQFVASGGRIVAVDGNTFYARVNYSASSNVETYVVGHDYIYNGTAAWLSNVRPYAVMEANWFGSVFIKGQLFASDPFYQAVSQYTADYGIATIDYAKVNLSGFGKLTGGEVIFNGEYIDGGYAVGPWEVNAIANFTSTSVVASYYGQEAPNGPGNIVEMLLYPPVGIYCHRYRAGSACSFGLFGEYLLLRGDANARYILVSLVSGMG